MIEEREPGLFDEAEAVKAALAVVLDPAPVGRYDDIKARRIWPE